MQDVGAFTFDIENERSYEWMVEYRGGLTRTWVDGTLMQERDISGEPLTVANPWQWNAGPDTPALLLGSWHSAVRFEWMELRSLE